MGQVICRLEDLAELQCLEFSLQMENGTEPVAAFVLRMGDEVRAYHNRCPHTGAPLNWTPEQFLSFDQTLIQCDIHGALFRLEDGRCVHGPCAGRSLQSVPITIEAGVVSTKVK